MEVVYRRGRATVSDVLSDLPDPPSYSSVRAMLRYLEDKGHLQHEEDGPRYVYVPTASKQEVRKSALGHGLSMLSPFAFCQKRMCGSCVAAPQRQS